MPGLAITTLERHELEQALARLETEYRLLSDQYGRGGPAGPELSESPEPRGPVDERTLLEGRIRQIRGWLGQDRSAVDGRQDF